ncbi:MAG: hypothetical protein M1281_02840 [Chloroflexi bacterium]|nr:hypothetical protein [Chloroflexota bacterium]
MSKVIIEVRDGSVQDVFSDDPDTNVILVDWDNIEDPGSGDGPKYFDVYPISEISEPTRQILEEQTEFLEEHPSC